MQRVIAYIDGFNLYFGLRDKGWKRYYWLDLQCLANALLRPSQTLAAVHYFTSRIRSDGLNAENVRRQTLYLEALGTRPAVHIHYGHFLGHARTCRACGAKWMSYEEKMTDVNIASQLLADAYSDQFDTALIVSGDSDLTTPIRVVRERFLDKRVVVAFPPCRRSHQLQQSAHGHFIISETTLRRSQLPPEVERADGFLLRRPAHWH